MTGLTLYQIEQELESLLDSVEVCPEELRPELEERIAQYVGSEITKVDGIGRVLSSLDAVQSHAKSEIERLQARRQAALNNAERLKSYILRVLAQRDGKPLKGNYTTFFAGRSEALIIDDPEAVPAEWKRTTVSVDIPKEPVKRAIKAGQTVPGAHIEQREYLGRR